MRDTNPPPLRPPCSLPERKEQFVQGMESVLGAFEARRSHRSRARLLEHARSRPPLLHTSVSATRTSNARKKRRRSRPAPTHNPRTYPHITHARTHPHITALGRGWRDGTRCCWGLRLQLGQQLRCEVFDQKVAVQAAGARASPVRTPHTHTISPLFFLFPFSFFLFSLL